MAWILSDNQNLMLERFATAPANWYLPLSEAYTINQSTLGSFLFQKWVIFDPSLGKEGGFKCTEAGKERWTHRKEANPYRSEGQFRRPLTSYFNPKAYGLRMVRKKTA